MAEDDEDVNATLGSETVGKRIKRLREMRGMSTADLASEAEMGEAAIKKLEKGDSNAPSLQNAVRIADALRVDIWTLAFGTDRPSIPAKIEEKVVPFVGEPAADEDSIEYEIDEMWTAINKLNAAARAILAALRRANISLPPLIDLPQQHPKRHRKTGDA